ncbi:MAG: flavin reductase family protein [Candidatus Caldarchaeum sp.]|nr:flavin reductase family protein [Candidatus Caldarchaeum sp.]
MFRKVPGQRVHRLFYPQSPAVVASAHRNEVGALLATSIMPVSLEPPMVGVALGRQQRTKRLVDLSGCFSACWVSYQSLEAVRKLAEPTEVGVADKLSRLGLRYRWGEVVKAPVLEDAVAWVECVVDWSRDVGDHVFYAAEVRAAYAVEDFEEYWGFRVYKPILYVGAARKGMPSFVRFDVE